MALPMKSLDLYYPMIQFFFFFLKNWFKIIKSTLYCLPPFPSKTISTLSTLLLHVSPPSLGGTPIWKGNGDASWKIWTKTLKETNVTVAQALSHHLKIWHRTKQKKATLEDLAQESDKAYREGEPKNEREIAYKNGNMRAGF